MTRQYNDKKNCQLILSLSSMLKTIVIYFPENFPLIMLSFVRNDFLVSSVPCQVGKMRDGRIVGGTNALRGSIPYIASLTRRGGHFCG